MRPASDALSLTLPSRSKSRTRRKRPRKPTLSELWWLGWALAVGGFAVKDLLETHLLYGLWEAVVSGIYWRAYQRERAGVRPALPFWLAATVVASAFAVMFSGWPGS